MTSIRSMILATITTVILFATSPSQADGLSAIVNGKSFHLGAVEDWNENNYGFGLEYEFANESRWKWKVMARPSAIDRA